MSTLVSDVINRAFEDLGVVTVNETITTAMQTDAFNRLNELVDQSSADGLTIPNQMAQAFALLTATTAYTFGPGGNFSTSARAMKVTGWRAYYNNILHGGGRCLSLAEFGEQAKQTAGEQTVIPLIVGADTAYPLINVRVFPPPNSTPGTLELDYWTPLTDFATVGDTITLPPGWLKYLRALLANDLYDSYPKPSILQKIQNDLAMAKAALVDQNAMTAPQPQPAAPQGQR